MTHLPAIIPSVRSVPFEMPCHAPRTTRKRVRPHAGQPVALPGNYPFVTAIFVEKRHAAFHDRMIVPGGSLRAVARAARGADRPPRAAKSAAPRLAPRLARFRLARSRTARSRLARSWLATRDDSRLPLSATGLSRPRRPARPRAQSPLHAPRSSKPASWARPPGCKNRPSRLL